MKKFIFCTILALICIQFSFSQTEGKTFYIKPGIGFGLGVFYPTEINDYIKDDLSDYITTNADLYANFFLRGSFGIQFNRYFVLEPVLEFAIAPKIIIGADGSYIFGRVSPGILANFHIPVSNGKHSVFLGGGALFHYMWFEDYSGSTIGPAIQGGISLNFGKSLNPEAYAGVNFARTQGKYNGSIYIDHPGPPELQLAYTDFHLGLRVNFKL